MCGGSRYQLSKRRALTIPPMNAGINGCLACYQWPNPVGLDWLHLHIERMHIEPSDNQAGVNNIDYHYHLHSSTHAPCMYQGLVLTVYPRDKGRLLKSGARQWSGAQGGPVERASQWSGVACCLLLATEMNHNT